MVAKSSERIPLRYSKGVTLIAIEGGADSVYVKAYNDELDPIWLLRLP